MSYLTFQESIISIANHIGLHYYLSKKFTKNNDIDFVLESLTYVINELVSNPEKIIEHIPFIIKNATRGVIGLGDKEAFHKKTENSEESELNHLVNISMQLVCLIFKNHNPRISDQQILDSIISYKFLITKTLRKNSKYIDDDRENLTLYKLGNLLNISHYKKYFSVGNYKNQTIKKPTKKLKQPWIFFHIRLFLMTSISSIFASIMIIVLLLSIIGYGLSEPFINFLFFLGFLAAGYLIYKLRTKPTEYLYRKIIINFVFTIQFLLVAVPLFAISGGLIIYILFNAIINPLQENFLLKYDNYYGFILS
jgi:hypothetical protein